MKTRHYFIILLLLVSYSLVAQLKVNSNGNIAIGYSSRSETFAVNGSIYSYGDIKTSSSLLTSQNLYCKQILPHSGQGTIIVGGSYNAPTMKIDNPHEYGGIGGNALSVNGDIVYNGILLVNSDKKLKKKIKNLNGSSILERIQKLDAKEYNLKSEKELLDLQRAGLSTYKQDTLDIQEEAHKILKHNMAKHPYYGKKVAKLDQTGIDSLINKKYIK